MWQLLSEGVEAALEGVAEEVCCWIGDEMLRLLKRFKAAFVERSPRRGGNPVFVRLIRQVAVPVNACGMLRAPWLAHAHVGLRWPSCRTRDLTLRCAVSRAVLCCDPALCRVACCAVL